MTTDRILGEDEDYRAFGAVNWSALKHILTSPAHYIWARDTRLVPSAAMQLGTAVHCAVLEPERFAKRYAVMVLDGRTKEGKVEKARLESDLLIPLSKSDKKHIDKLAQAARSTAMGSQIDGALYREVGFTWLDRATGIVCKGQADAVFDHGDHLLVVDLKTCSAGDSVQTIRAKVKYDYAPQLMFYARGLACVLKRPVRCAVIYVPSGETAAPQAFDVHIGEETAEFAGEQVARALSKLAEMRFLGLPEHEWPGPSAMVA